MYRSQNRTNTNVRLDYIIHDLPSIDYMCTNKKVDDASVNQSLTLLNAKCSQVITVQVQRVNPIFSIQP